MSTKAITKIYSIHIHIQHIKQKLFRGNISFSIIINTKVKWVSPLTTVPVHLLIIIIIIITIIVLQVHPDQPPNATPPFTPPPPTYCPLLLFGD